MKTKCNGTWGVRRSENKSSHGQNINERDCGCFPGKPYFLAHGLGLADSWCEVISRHQDFLITPDISCQSSSYRNPSLVSHGPISLLPGAKSPSVLWHRVPATLASVQPIRRLIPPSPLRPFSHAIPPPRMFVPYALPLVLISAATSSGKPSLIHTLHTPHVSFLKHHIYLLHELGLSW